MDEEKIKDSLTPSEIAIAAVDDKAEKKEQTVPSEIISDTANEDVGIDDTATVKPADGSIKNAISQITEKLNEEPETVAPIINVHVDSPVIKESSEKVTNNSLEKDTTNSIFSEKTEILPSEIAVKEAEENRKEKKDDDFKAIKTDLISSDKATDILSKPNKEVGDNEESTPSSSSKLAAENKSTNAVEIPEIKQVKNPISLTDILANDKLEIDKISVLQKDNNEPSTTSEPVSMTPSLMMESLIKESESATSQMVVLNENLSKTISVLQESEKIKDSADRIEKIEQLSTSTFLQYLENSNLKFNSEPLKPTGILSETSNVNNETTNNTKKIADFHILLEQRDSGSENGNITVKSDNSLIPNSVNLSESSDEIRVVIPDSKLNAQLAKSMLTTPESKQLSAVNDNLAKVKTALEEVNASQVSNNQTISNIINNSTSTVNTPGNQNREINESKSISEVKKENDNKLEPNRNELSEYYLHAIYDALVSSGIKIKQY